ncbi:TSUP family transporter [Sphingobium indicum]|uniref:TSUP family transporter n=1 Tax=Sphingobium indicum TaxID=332055 RepID=UPI0026AE33C1
MTASRLLPRFVPIGLGVGIGGGFLIVPGLMTATAMPLKNAVGTSLVVVTALGLTTAASYALSGYVDWLLLGIMMWAVSPARRSVLRSPQTGGAQGAARAVIRRHGDGRGTYVALRGA